jgi:hypothetical protein
VWKNDMQTFVTRVRSKRDNPHKGWNAAPIQFHFLSPFKLIQQPSFRCAHLTVKPVAASRIVRVRLFLRDPFQPGKSAEFRLLPWLLTAMNKLQNFKSLKEGWNGYSAVPPSPLALHHASQFLLLLNNSGIEPTRLAPSAVGGVGITRRVGALKVYVEFYNDGTVFALFADDDKLDMFTRPVEPTHDGYKAIINDLRKYLNG